MWLKTISIYKSSNITNISSKFYYSLQLTLIF